MLKKSFFYIAPILIALIVSACAKERETKFAQGQGRDFKSVSDYRNKRFVLNTGQAIGHANVTASESLTVEDSAKGVNNFPIVSYSTDAKLLGEVPFRGRPNLEYTIEYRLTDSYLKVVKVAAEKDIPYSEIPYIIGNW